MMQTAGVTELKKELDRLPPKAVKELCLRLVRYKVENKELLSYLLFDAQDEEAFIRNIKEETDKAFAEINAGNLYWAKKSIRKILRLLNKYIKYSGNKQTEAELLLHFCNSLNDSGIRFRQSPVLLNLYLRQVERIRKSVSRLHEDLQYDYTAAIEALD